MEYLFPNDLDVYLNNGYLNHSANQDVSPHTLAIKPEPMMENNLPEGELSKFYNEIGTERKEYVADQQNQRGMNENYTPLPRTRKTFNRGSSLKVSNNESS